MKQLRRTEKIQIVLAAGVLLCGMTFTVLTFMGMRFSGLLLMGISCLLLLSAALGYLSRKRASFRIVQRLLYGAVILGLLIFGALEAQVIGGAMQGQMQRADAAVVLGAGVRGTTPSLSLHCRLETALEFAQTYPDALLVLSGGQGSGEEITEAECMRRYLAERGVPEERIRLEENAETTEENLAFSKVILEENGFLPEQNTVAVISNDFHLFRAKLLAEKAGFSAVGIGEPLPWAHLEVNYMIREAFALVKTYLL